MRSLFGAYITSSRPATLLLALACAILGGALALFAGKFDLSIFVLTVLTALSLQILSNFANDYGDFQKGADKVGQRIGPVRAIQKGAIDALQLKQMIIFSVVVSILLGSALLYTAFSAADVVYVLAFLLLGVAAIWAAIKYTAGKNPYGYRGLGDIFTFIFFGPVAVVGAYFLQTHHIDFMPWLPGIAFGIFTMMVLNINNMRDAVNDALVGKVTIAVKLGSDGAKHYHAALTCISFLCFLCFNVMYALKWYQYGYLIVYVGFFATVKSFYHIKNNIEYVPYLKRTVVLSFILTILFSLSINLH